MAKYFRIEEITENEFEEALGIDECIFSQTIVEVDGVVFVGIDDNEDEMQVPIDFFEGD